MGPVRLSESAGILLMGYTALLFCIEEMLMKVNKKENKK